MKTKILYIIVAVILIVTMFTGCSFKKEKTDKTTTGKENYISEQEAKKKALEHAGVSENDVTFDRVEIDYDNHRAVYEVEFHKDTTEYDYEIDAADGQVVSYDNDQQASTTGVTDEAIVYISEEVAKLNALTHANFSENEITLNTIEFENNDGKPFYEIEFNKDKTKYDYKIDAVDGSVIAVDIDNK